MSKFSARKLTDTAKRSILRLSRKMPDERAIRKELTAKEQLHWWCVYGSPRGGTTYISRLAKTGARLWTGDWRMGDFLAGVELWRELREHPDHEYIEFDYARLLKDISRNIIDNAYSGDGDQLDFFYKQADMKPGEHRTLVNMWGPPARLIFCLREPSGFIASTQKKFPDRTLESLQDHYVICMNSYTQIGGEIFEYRPVLQLEDYTEFLKPLNLPPAELPTFRYKGVQEEGSTSQAMWDAYQQVKALA